MIKRLFIIFFLSLILVTSMKVKANQITVVANDMIKYEDMHLKHVFGDAQVTNDEGTTTNQKINVITANLNNSNLVVATWQKYGSTTPSLATVLDHAKDFELHNPNYEVMGAINADYFFASKYTVNAHKDFNGNILNYQNHTKYDSLIFDKKVSNLKSVKKITYRRNYDLVIRSKSDNRIISYYPNLSQTEPVTGEKVVFCYGRSIMKSVNYLEFEIQFNNMTDNNLFIYGHNPVKKSGSIDASNDRIQVIYDDKLLTEFNNNSNLEVRVIKATNDHSFNDMVLGYDNHIIRNHTIPAFSELKGQSDEHNKYRHPRSGMAITDDGKIILITVDGRQPGISNGVNLREFGYIMEHYDAKDGYNLDGGGSTQMIFRNQVTNQLEVVNTPSEGTLPNGFRAVGNVLLVARPKIKSNFKVTETTDLLTFNYQLKDGEMIMFYHNNEQIIPNNNQLNINKETGIISVVIRRGDQMIKVFEKIYNLAQNEVEPPPNQIEIIEIKHEIEGNDLVIKLSYDDPESQIDLVGVVYQKNQKRYPMRILSQGIRECKIPLTDLEYGNNSFLVLIDYDNNKQMESTLFTFNYEEPTPQQNIEKEANFFEKNKMAIIIGSAAIGVIAISSILIFIKRKRQ